MLRLERPCSGFKGTAPSGLRMGVPA
jgi:hypothetical protein